MNFNITHLRQGVNDMPPPINADLAVQYSKLHQFQVFRWAFLAYLLSPTALLIVKVTVLSWEYEWLNECAAHGLFLVGAPGQGGLESRLNPLRPPVRRVVSQIYGHCH